MSIPATAWAWEIVAKEKLTVRQRLLLVALAVYADDEGVTTLSLSELRKMTRSSSQTVTRAIARLVELRLVTVMHSMCPDVVWLEFTLTAPNLAPAHHGGPLMPERVPMTEDEHRARHVELHLAFDELFADFIEHHRDRVGFLDTTIREFVAWSHRQTVRPDSLEPR